METSNDVGSDTVKQDAYTDEWLTVQDAATRSGRGETAIRNAMLRERLPFEMRYGRKLIKAADLEAYIQNTKMGRPKKVKS